MNPEPEWKTVQDLTRERTGVTPEWKRSEENEAIVRQQIDELLAAGLTRDGAVQIALLNNPVLQAAFADLGEAKAEEVQAGLYTNPSFSIFFAFPLSLSDSYVTLSAMLSDLWMIPARQKVFDVRTEKAIRTAGLAAVNTAAEAGAAYDDVLYRTAEVELEQSILGARQGILQTAAAADRRRTATELTALQSEVEAQDIAVAAAQNKLTAARAQLDLILALPEEQAGYRLADSLEGRPSADWTRGAAVPFALEHRLDVASARLQVEERKRAIDYEYARIPGPVSLGVSYEGDFDRTNAKGPGATVQLPIFDQNQAQIAKAEYRLEQAQRSLTAAEHRARAEVTVALSDIDFRRKQIDILKRGLPSTEANEPFQRLPNLNGVASVDELTADTQTMTKRRDYLQALWQLSRAQIRLHKALWGGSSP